MAITDPRDIANALFGAPGEEVSYQQSDQQPAPNTPTLAGAIADAKEWMGKYQNLTIAKGALEAQYKDMQEELYKARQRVGRLERWIDSLLEQRLD